MYFYRDSASWLAEEDDDWSEDHRESRTPPFAATRGYQQCLQTTVGVAEKEDGFRVLEIGSTPTDKFRVIDVRRGGSSCL